MTTVETYKYTAISVDQNKSAVASKHSKETVSVLTGSALKAPSIFSRRPHPL
jgi:hypothetical protein